MQKILIIDDDEVIRQLLVDMLTKEGYDTRTASNGDEGLAVFDSYQPDLVITDFVMPGLDGIEVIQRIKATRWPTRIVAISGGDRNGAHSNLNSAILLGADITFPKPFRFHDLIESVHTLLHAHPN